MRREKFMRRRCNFFASLNSCSPACRPSCVNDPGGDGGRKVQVDTNKNLIYLDPVVSRRPTSPLSDHSEPPAFVSGPQLRQPIFDVLLSAVHIEVSRIPCPQKYPVKVP